MRKMKLQYGEKGRQLRQERRNQEAAEVGAGQTSIASRIRSALSQASPRDVQRICDQVDAGKFSEALRMYQGVLKYLPVNAVSREQRKMMMELLTASEESRFARMMDAKDKDMGEGHGSAFFRALKVHTLEPIDRMAARVARP